MNNGYIKAIYKCTCGTRIKCFTNTPVECTLCETLKRVYKLTLSHLRLQAPEINKSYGEYVKQDRFAKGE